MNVFAKKVGLVCLGLLFFLAVDAKEVKIDGATVYDNKCSVCHEEGKAGSPKVGDKKSWQSRLEKGIDTLFHRVINPEHHVRCYQCTDLEVKEAVKYMATKSGAGNTTLW
jgi:cytochrome c5